MAISAWWFRKNKRRFRFAESDPSATPHSEPQITTPGEQEFTSPSELEDTSPGEPQITPLV
jgi:hypothetical protein